MKINTDGKWTDEDHLRPCLEKLAVFPAPVQPIALRQI